MSCMRTFIADPKARTPFKLSSAPRRPSRAQTRRDTSCNSKSSVRGMESSDSSVSEYSDGSGSSARVVRKSNSSSRRVGPARAATLRRFSSTRVQSALWTVRSPLVVRHDGRPISEYEACGLGNRRCGLTFACSTIVLSVGTRKG